MGGCLSDIEPICLSTLTIGSHFGAWKAGLNLRRRIAGNLSLALLSDGPASPYLKCSPSSYPSDRI